MSLNAGFYDHPIDEDAIGKMIATNKYAVSAGLAWSVIDVLMISKPKGYLPTMSRIVFNTGPLVGIASAFTMGTYAAASFRKKDDRVNYIIGGLCAGGVVGATAKSFVGGLVAGGAFAIAGVVKKLSKEEGWDFFPEVKHAHGNLRSVRHDWTLMAERPRNWSTGKEN